MRLEITIGDDEVLRLTGLELKREGQAGLPLTDADVDSVEAQLVRQDDDSLVHEATMAYEPATAAWVSPVPSSVTEDLAYRGEYRGVAVVTIDGKRHTADVVHVSVRKGAVPSP